MTRLCLLLVAFLVAAWTPLAAHTSPNTEIRLEPNGNALVARITIPASDYASATGNPIGEEPATLGQAEQEVAQRFSITSHDRLAWSIRVDSIELTTGTGPADLNAIVTARPARGASTRSIDLRWDMFPANAPGHIAMVMMDKDGIVAEDTIRGALTSRSKSLAIDLGRAVNAIPAPSEPDIEDATAADFASVTWPTAGLAIGALFALVALVNVMLRRRKQFSTPDS